jgi:ATP/maltotriose-dependent transcriptional regulator MalT
MWTGNVTPGLLERGAEIEERSGLELEWLESPRTAFARLLVRQGEIERPRAIYEDIRDRAAARGDERSRVLALWMLATVEWLAGRWPIALGHCDAAYQLGEQTEAASERAWVGRLKAVVEADLGLVAESRSSALEGLAIAEATSNEFYAIASQGALGRLELALGNIDGAAAHLEQLPARLMSAGFNEPTNPVWADSIETLVAHGQPHLARSYLSAYEANARAFGSPWAIAASHRCRGIVDAGTGDTASALASLHNALEVLDDCTYPFERGRILLATGVVRRQARQKAAARADLEEARAIFDQLGARLWVEKSSAELRRISGRRAAGDQLTETERQVAILAAEGNSNKHIATALFMGVSTVEAHLTRVYRKLHVTRAELATALASRPENEVNSMGTAPQT